MSLPAGLPERTLGIEVIKWCSKYLRQPDGEHAGERWQFTKRQQRFILWLYAVDENGKWLYHRAVMRSSKGTGKSPFVAALALCELMGPVRFSRMADGEVIGKPVAMPWVQIAATAESQTTNTMSMVTAMVPPESRVRRDYALDVGKQRIYTPGGGRLEIITASAHAAEGARATFAIADETEWWIPGNGGTALDGVIRRNLAKTGGRLIETCNAFVPGMESVAEKSHDAWVAQEEGRTRKGGVLYDAIEAPADVDVTDEEDLRRGLRIAYSEAPWIDLDRIVAEYYDPSTSPDVARRMYLNQIVASEDSWCSPQEWQSIAKSERTVEDEEDIVAFFDGSKSGDATGILGCCVSDGHVFTIGVWEPNGKDEVDAKEVDEVVHRMFERWNVVGFFADVREWESFVKVSWPDEFGEKLLIHAQPSGREPQPIAWDMRSRGYDFTLAAETCYAEIVDKAFTHDGDLTLMRHVHNAKRRPNRWGTSIGKETKNSPRKIDLAVCLIGVRLVRRQLLSSPEWAKRSRKRTGRAYGF